jgi:anti-sigma factor RsiW
MGEHTMTNQDDHSAFDQALRRQLREAADEPADDGFSLRVMAALAPKGVTPEQRRWARWVLRAQWVAISAAALGTAALLVGASGRLDVPDAVATVVLVGLLVFWSVPSRWSRG